MLCANLKGEMAKKGITIEEMAAYLKIHRNSVANKINGDTAFNVDEAFKIQKKFFPKFTVEYLFQKENVDVPQQNKEGTGKGGSRNEGTDKT
jgi:phage protein